MRSTTRTGTRQAYRSLTLGAALLCAGLCAVWLLPGCSANEPFDPASVPNQPPTVNLFVGPVDPTQNLAPTSYYQRTFRWTGSDPDGWVTAYYVSIQTDPAVPAPWAETQGNDTTMTFVTNDEGEATAVFHLVCRDDRGAYSDTTVQVVPIRNFPPVVDFAEDYDPLYNLQREYDLEENPVYWNWGVNNFRLYAYDEDGRAVMNDTYRYTLADDDPDIVWSEDDPLADPETGWIEGALDPTVDAPKFEIFVSGLEPGWRTLRVEVGDAADAVSSFSYSWEVRAPRGAEGSRVLLVRDANLTEPYYAALDEIYGAEGWDELFFWFTYPDNGFVLLETFRQFDLVIWPFPSGASTKLITAVKLGGVLDQYLRPQEEGIPAGKLLLASPKVTGDYLPNDFPRYFLYDLMGISHEGTTLTLPDGKAALGAQTHLPAMTVAGGAADGVQLLPPPVGDGAETIYAMEYCLDPECYAEGRYAPKDPIVAVRRPYRTEGLAQVVTFGLNLEEFDLVQTVPALRAILEQELGVAP